MTKFRKNKGPKASQEDESSRKAPSRTTATVIKMEDYKTVQDLSLGEKRELIAEWSELILEDPSQNAFSSTGTLENGMKIPSRVRRLIEFGSFDKNGHDANIAQLALLSLLSLFGDILPSYRIRLPTEAEMAVKVSKETKKTWDYERALLTHYQQYLKLLTTTWTDQYMTNPSLAVTALLCVCQLLQKAPHFNLRSNLLALVTKNAMHSVTEVSEACCQALEHVCSNDAQGEIALEIARKVSKLLKDRNYRCSPRVLRVFLSIPLRVHVDEAQAAKLAAQANTKKRKRNKEAAEVEDELKESSGRVDKIVLARSQSDTLQTVILVYFRVIKGVGELEEERKKKSNGIQELLPPALEGLAKFAHLINLDTVLDLLDALKTLLGRVDTLPLDAALHCVMTAFQTLEGPGRELKIDQKEYIAPLYAQLGRICTESAARDHTDLLIQCLTLALLKRREYATARLAAFFKQICTIALHVPAHASAPLLAFARQLLQRYGTVLQPLLENEQDVITSGQYGPFRHDSRDDPIDPDLANPFATSAWELATLRFHIHPAVVCQATGAAAEKRLQLPAETPERVRVNQMRDMHDLYIPCKRNKRRHPLEKNKKGKHQNQRFISPRPTGQWHLLEC